MTEEERKEAEIEKGKKIQRNWITIASGYAYEFGAIIALPETIEAILNVNPDILGKKRYFFEESDKEKLSTTDFESIYDVLHRNVGGGLLSDKKGTSSFR